MKYLLDSNVVSEPIRVKPKIEVVERLAACRGEACIAAPVWHELKFGCALMPRSKRRKDLDSYLRDIVRSHLPIIDYDFNAANWHASERARLVAKGLTPSFIDGQIAAIAYVNDLTLVTLNLRHFKLFAGLRVEAW